MYLPVISQCFSYVHTTSSHQAAQYNSPRVVGGMGPCNILPKRCVPPKMGIPAEGPSRKCFYKSMKVCDAASSAIFGLGGVRCSMQHRLSLDSYLWSYQGGNHHLCAQHSFKLCRKLPLSAIILLRGLCKYWQVVCAAIVSCVFQENSSCSQQALSDARAAQDMLQQHEGSSCCQLELAQFKVCQGQSQRLPRQKMEVYDLTSTA